VGGVGRLRGMKKDAGKMPALRTAGRFSRSKNDREAQKEGYGPTAISRPATAAKAWKSLSRVIKDTPSWRQLCAIRAAPRRERGVKW
jgi:hypothetical protein